MPKIDIKETPALTVASLESTGSFDEVGRVFMELFRWVLVSGGKVASYPMALFPSPPDQVPAEGVRFEACIPIDPAAALKPGDGVAIRQLPAATVAFVRHHGGYGKVGLAYDRILTWAAQAGYKVAGPSRELYLTNPMQTEEGDLVTEIQVPVRKSA
ncbi:MAG: GyrI-like domain-containing protein [bacterium]|nr:GyrI-like domain-containing protein [bacterium]